MKLTAADAIKYNGLDSLLGKGADFGYVDGHVYSTDDTAHKVTAFDAQFTATFDKMGFN